MVIQDLKISGLQTKDFSYINNKQSNISIFQ